jgi:ribonuclease Z
LSQINPPPRLAVATHFPVADDTVASAFNSVQAHCTNIVFGRDIVWSFDLMVIRVFPDRIEQYRADVSDFAWSPVPQQPLGGSGGFYPPKYRDANGVGDPFAQIDTNSAIPAVSGSVTNYNPNGY